MQKILSYIYLTTLTVTFIFLHNIFITNLTVNFDRITIKKSATLPLRFRSDTGTFKILQVADMHYGQGKLTRCKDVSPSEFPYCSDLNTTSFVRRLIQLEQPDFLAFTGDNIFGTSTPDAAESLFGAFRAATESGLPWAAVLGNHDQESTMTREELMTLISLMDYSVSEVNPWVRDPSGRTERVLLTNVHGFGNYNLTVHGPYGSLMVNSSVLNLFFLDSGDRAVVDGRRTYGWIKDSQLNWIRGLSHGEQDSHWLSDSSGIWDMPRNLPLALGFFHIPIPETRQLYYQKVVGQFQEAIACSSVNSGVLQALVSMKNVKAVFIGHDHVNDFCGNLDGIWFCYGGGSGYHGYGRIGVPRKARIILAELSKGDSSWMGMKRISTWKRIDDDMLSKIDEQVLWDQDT